MKHKIVAIAVLAISLAVLCSYSYYRYSIERNAASDKNDFQNHVISPNNRHPNYVDANSVGDQMFSYFKDTYGSGQYPPNYGGCYLKSQKLVILVTDTSSTEDIIESYGLAPNSSKVIAIRQVAHSLKDLEGFRVSVTDYLLTLDIKRFLCYIDEEENQVNFVLLQGDYEKINYIIQYEDLFCGIPLNLQATDNITVTLD